MTAPLATGWAWGVLLVLWLAVEELRPVRRLAGWIVLVIVGVLVRARLID